MDSHNEIPGLIPNRRNRPRKARRSSAATLRAVSPLPPPEEVFIDWLMSVPHDANIEGAARRQIALIDQRGTMHPHVQCLRTLLVAVAGATHWQKPVSNL